MVNVKKVTKIFDKNNILKDVSINFNDHSFNIIVGYSGCGKTTLLNIIAGLVEPDEGEVLYNNQKIYSDIITYNLVEDMNINILNVYDNLRIVENDITSIDEMLIRLGIINLKNKKVSKLSKGEQARVSIARALLRKTEVLLLDEPTGNLDNETARIIFEVLKEESKKRTIILATHDRDFALEYADFLYQLNNGELTVFKETRIDDTNTCDVLYHNTKIPERLLLKYTAKKFIVNKIMFSLNIVLVCFSIATLVLAIGFKNVDDERTKANLLEDFHDDIIEIVDNEYQIGTSDHSYMKGKEIAHTINLFNDQTPIKAIFYEEVKDFLLLDTYQLDENLYENTSAVTYYPIILYADVQQYFCEQKKISYEIGDIFDYQYQTNLRDYKVKFVIVDILNDKLTISQDSTLSPVIIPKRSYHDIIENLGYYDNKMFDSYDAIASEFNNHYTNNEFRFPLFGSNTQLLKKALLGTTMSEYNPNSYEDGLYYIGKLPENKNEIMLSARDDYWLLTGDYRACDVPLSDNFKTLHKEFLDLYDGNYGFTIPRIFSNQSISYFKIVGCIVRIKNGVPQSTNLGVTVISDSLYDTAYKRIIEEDYVLYAGNFYISHNELMMNFNEYLSGRYRIFSEYIDNYKAAMNYQGYADFLYKFGLVFFIIGSLVSVIYINSTYKTMKKDFTVLYLYGKQKKEIFKISLYNMVLLALPMIFGIIIGFILLDNQSVKHTRSAGFQNVKMIFNRGTIILTVLLYVFIYFLITVLPLLKAKNYKVLDVLKNE